jgi:hypothetical protein
MEASQRITGRQNVFGQRLTEFVQESRKHSMKVGLVEKPKHSARSISLIAKTQHEHKVKASLRITGSQHVSSQTS